MTPTPGLSSQHRLERGVLRRLVDRAPHLEAQVRPREAGDGDLRIAHAELARDVVAHFGGRRRGEREDRRPPEPLDD